jgi:rhodanese-related sulfurtransferase
MNHSPAFLKLVEEAMPRVKEISAEEVMALLFFSPHRGEVGRGANGESSHTSPLPNPPPMGEGTILIDVREDNEWSSGHITGATHLGRGIIERDIETKIPDKNTKLILYCGGGFRSALAADNLQKMGYTHVYSLEGGWRNWCERGFPKICI